jgi:hypothetical protein
MASMAESPKYDGLRVLREAQEARRQRSRDATDVIHINEFVRIRPWQHAEAHSAYVRQLRAGLAGGVGVQIWYRAEDWADDGTLIASTEDRALDPWANLRAKREPCPALLHWSEDLSSVEPAESQNSVGEQAQSQSGAESLTPESHAEPWVAAGVSRATWFRRKRQAEAPA